MEAREPRRLLKSNCWYFAYSGVQPAEELQRMVHRLPKSKQWGSDGLTPEMIRPQMVER